MGKMKSNKFDSLNWRDEDFLDEYLDDDYHFEQYKKKLKRRKDTGYNDSHEDFVDEY